jgi:long-chain acyl-CoA synthetase
MQVIYCAAAPCADYVKTDINQLFKQQGASKNVFHEYYGSSEAACISVLLPIHYEEKPERYKSVGKVMGCDLKIYKPDEKRECVAGEEGHVIIRSARMYSLNYGNSNEMDKSFIEVDGSLWFDDGCIGYLDEDQFLYLTTRSKDMIISGGVNIFPVELEEVIRKHKNVLDVAVVKVKDADLGEVAGALIQTVDNKNISEGELLAFCKEQGLYGFKIPKHFKFTTALPKNTAGKIRKVELEAEFKNS